MSQRDDELLALLRAELARRATTTPREGFDMRVEQTVRDLQRPRGHGHRLFGAGVALAAVAAVAVAVTAGVRLHQSNRGAQLPVPTSAASPTLQGVVVPAPTTTPAPTALPALMPQQVLDLSWVSNSEGWALLQETCGTAQCERVAHTTDGVHWSDVGAVPVDAAACRSNGACSTKIRFASSKVGYLFGDVLLITSDGGRTWHNGSGRTDDLEIAGGTAVRVTSAAVDPGGLGLHFSVQVAPVGSDTWRTVLDAVPGPGITPRLQRDGAKRIYVTSLGNSAGAGAYVSPIATSADGGNTWSQIADPCNPSSVQEHMLLGMSAAPSGRLVVTCLNRTDSGTESFTLRVSTNAGANFAAEQPEPGWASFVAPDQTVVLSDGTLVAVGEQPSTGTVTFTFIEVSHDGGRTWTKTADLGVLTPTTYVAGLGFQDARTGRVALAGTLWTTHDGGSTWSRSQI